MTKTKARPKPEGGEAAIEVTCDRLVLDDGSVFVRGQVATVSEREAENYEAAERGKRV